MSFLIADDYLETFEARGNLYNAAMRLAPAARETERRLLIDLMRVQPDDVVCDLPAGGGYLADGLRDDVKHDEQIICVEPSRVFAASLRKTYRVLVAPLTQLPLPDDGVDCVGSLAGLHHLENRPAFFDEVARIIRPGGQFAAADVRVNTPNAAFLNGPVDELSETGHDGDFLEEGELSDLLSGAGFGDVQEWFHSFEWQFESFETLIAFCTSLFGMVRAGPAQVEDALRDHFDLRVDDSGAALPWSLAYAVGTMPA